MHQRHANLNYQNRQLFDVTNYNDNKFNNLLVDYASTNQPLKINPNLKVDDLNGDRDTFFHHNENKLKNNFNNSFDDLVIFGDSYSDTGNAFHLSNNTFPPSPPYFAPFVLVQITFKIKRSSDIISDHRKNSELRVRQDEIPLVYITRLRLFLTKRDLKFIHPLNFH